jgi:type IV pilus assembly protein PilB
MIPAASVEAVLFAIWLAFDVLKRDKGTESMQAVAGTILEGANAFLSRQYGVPSINLSHFEIDGSVIKLIPSEIAQKHQVIPINRTGNILTVAMADPSNIFAIDDDKFMTGFKIEPEEAAETSINNAINKYYHKAGMVEDIMKTFDDKDVEALKDDDDGVNAAELGKAAEDAPVVKLVNLILTDAIKKSASDIHIEPY